jgi:hypothetical protein
VNVMTSTIAIPEMSRVGWHDIRAHDASAPWYRGKLHCSPAAAL